MPEKSKIACPSHIAWAVETYGIYVINQQTGEPMCLYYPDAALWELISQGYLLEKASCFLSHIADISQADANVIVADLIQKWTTRGFLDRG